MSVSIVEGRLLSRGFHMKKCPDCGDDHEVMFSEEVLSLYEEVCEAADKYERADFMIELAKQFCGDADDTDEYLGEDIHALLTEVIQNRVVYERSAMALGRLLMRHIPAYLEVHGSMEEPESSGPAKPDPKAN